MQIYCRQCGKPIKASNIHLDHMMAKCDQCDAVFSFADMYADVQPKASKRPSAQRIAKPEGITVVHTDDELVIQRKWNNYGHSRFTLISVIFNSAWWWFLPSLNGVFSLLAIPVSIVAMACLLYAIIGLVNTMTIRVTNTTIDIINTPVAVSNRSIATKDIDRFDIGTPFELSSLTTHRLYVTLFNGEAIGVFTTINEGNDADYIKQEIDAFLGLDS